MGVPCETSTPKTSVPVSVWVSKCTRPTAPWRRAQARMSGSAIEWSPPRTIGMAPAATTSPTVALDRLMGAGRVGRQHRRVAEVDDAELGEAVDAGLQVRPGRAARGADRARPEPGPGPVGDEVIRGRADDRDVDARELGRVLRVRHAAEAEQPGEVGLAPQGLPALERIDQTAGIIASGRHLAGL